MSISPIRLAAERVRFVVSSLAALPRSKSGEERSLQQKLVSDTCNYFVSKVVPGIMGFLTVLVFVRVVGYDQYGRYAMIFAAVTALSAGVSGWLSQAVLRFQSSYCGEENHRFGSAVNKGIALSALVGGTGLGMSIWLSGGQSLGTIAGSIGLYMVMLIYAVILARYQASLLSGAVLRMETARAVGAFVLPLVLIAATHRRHFSLLLVGIAFGYLLPIVTQKGFHPIYHRRVWLGLVDRPEWHLLRSFWQYGWPVALWLLCQQSLVIVDRYFVERYLGFSSAGIYASMYDVIVRSFSLVMTPITLAVHSVVMNHWNSGNRHRALRTLGTGASYQLALFVPVVGALLLLGPGLTHLVLGRYDQQAAAIVLPLAVGGFLWQMALLAHKPLEVLCQTKRMLVAMLAALVVNALGNSLLIPKFGLKAPAYLSVTTSIVYLIMISLLTPVGQLKDAISSGERLQLGVARSSHLTTA